MKAQKKNMNCGEPILLGKVARNGVLRMNYSGADAKNHDLFWLFCAAHLLHKRAYDKKDRKALRLIKAFCKSVDAEYMK